MARNKKEVEAVTASHLDDMIKVLKISIDALQAMIADSVKTKQISIAELSRATKMIGETLNQIYRIEYGKKQKEEMLQKIGELQRHFDRAQQVSAERVETWELGRSQDFQGQANFPSKTALGGLKNYMKN
jgi:lambda repressor-like predicted transcriptional regulator